MTNKNQIALMETLNELVEMAKEISSKKWFINSDEEVTAIDNDAGPDDSEEAFIGCAANIQLAKYIAAASPETILAIAEAFRALEKLAEAAGDRNALVAGGIEAAVKLQERAEKAEAELAKLKGDAVPFMYAICHPDGSAWMDEGCVALDQSHLGVVLADLRRETGEDYHMVPVFTHAQPVPVLEQWTKCSDRMPEYGRYLVKCENPLGLEIVTAEWLEYQYSSSKDGITEMWRDDRSRSMNRMKTVTHWMPLPRAPKSADGEGGVMGRLKMVCQMDGVTKNDYCDLPKDWESMSDEEKAEFEQECLEGHIANCVDAWTEVKP